MPPPVQVYVTPLIGVPSSVTVGEVQVIEPLAVMAGEGAVVLEGTPIVIVEEHKEIVFITTTVYWPPAFTEAVAVVAPDTIPGPDQV